MLPGPVSASIHFSKHFLKTQNVGNTESSNTFLQNLRRSATYTWNAFCDENWTNPRHAKTIRNLPDASTKYAKFRDMYMNLMFSLTRTPWNAQQILALQKKTINNGWQHVNNHLLSKCEKSMHYHWELRNTEINSKIKTEINSEINSSIRHMEHRIWLCAPLDVIQNRDDADACQMYRLAREPLGTHSSVRILLTTTTTHC